MVGTLPTLYDITIYIDDVDVTIYVPHESLAHEDYARQVSSFKMTVQNPSGVTPARGMPVRVVANSVSGTPTIFNGYIVELITRKRDNGITQEYELDCGDLKWRLQNAILGYNELSGSDFDIFSALFNNAYPDLTSLFEFDFNSLIDEMDFAVNDESLLDALNRLADETGADWRLNNGSEGAGFTVDFDGGYDSYTLTVGAGDTVSDTGTGFGEESLCAEGVDGNASGGVTLTIDMTFDGTPEIETVEFRYWFTHNGTLSVKKPDLFIVNGGSSTQFAAIVGETDIDTWHNILFRPTAGTQSPRNESEEGSEIRATSGLPTSTYTSIRLRCAFVFAAATSATVKVDDIQINGGATTPNEIVWDAEPDSAAFDIDVQNSDEYATDIELFEGDWDDFNSILVTGGFEDTAIDWTYDADGEQDHFDLELPVKGLVVYKNTGSDTSPTWTEQDLGAWGGATFVSDGGSADVLYDSENHWLYFDTNPANLVKSIRITGTIQRPIKVQVDGVQGDDPVLATSISDDSITSLDDAVSLGNAALEKQNSIKRLNFRTYEPGLKPGQAMTVTDSARGLTETLTIQRIATKWLGGRNAEFDVECGEAEATGADSLIANADKRSRDRGPSQLVNIQVVNLLTDDSDVVMTDDSGEELYESETRSLYTDDSNELMTDDSLAQLYEAA